MKVSRIAFAFWLFATFFGPISSNCQELKLNTNDTMSINAAAKEQLSNLRDNLNLLADPSTDAASKESVINNMVEPPENIFDHDRVFVELDLDPAITKPGGSKLQAKEYLHNYILNFVPKAGQSEPVSFGITDISCVRLSKSSNTMYVVVSFWETFDGTDKSGVPHTNKKYRSVTFDVAKTEGKWKAHINSLSFDGGTSDPAECITITGAPDEVNFSTQTKSEGYYTHLLVKGNGFLNDNAYVDAYLAFREASNSKNKDTKKDARLKIEEMKNKMKNNGINEIKDTWSKGLLKKGKDFEALHRYEEAHRCYQYAYELVSTDGSLPPKIQSLSAKLDIQSRLEGLYNNKQYDVALKEYSTQLAADNMSPLLYVGRAKCNMALGKESDARKDFANAIKLDNTNLEAYKWQGYFMEQMRTPNFIEAAKSFSLFLNNCDDKSDTSLNDIYSELSYVYGMIALRKSSYSEALDSFKASCVKRPQFERGILFQGVCYLKMKDNKKALQVIETVLGMNPKNAEAHYWKAQLEAQSSSKEGQEEYINELKQALTYDVRNSGWNLELGLALKNTGMYQDAMVYLKNCMDAKQGESSIAMWRRGECSYKVGNYSDAFDNYSAYSEYCSKSGGMNVQPEFYVDLGFVYLMKEDASKAIENFNKGNNSPEAMYGLGEAYYLQDANNSSKYNEYFESAFKKGLNADLVNSDPFLSGHPTLAENREFKGLRKKYKK